MFVIVFVGGFLSAGFIIKSVLSFIQLEGVSIAATSPFQYITVATDVGFFLAILATAPYIIYSFYVFMLPALTLEERSRLIKSVPISFGLFAIGFFYGVFVLYYSLEILAVVNINLGIVNIWDIGQFISQIFITSALLGFVFELPLFLALLIKIGITTPEDLKKKRRLAYFAILCVTGLLPPTDLLSLFAMTFPLVLLYEVTILLNKENKHVRIRRG